MLDKIRDLLKKKNSLVTILVIITLLIGVLETFVYYKDKNYAWYYLLVLGITNGIRMFNFNSTMKAVDVLGRLFPKEPGQALPVWESAVHHIFFIFSFIAPLLLVAVVYVTANYFLNNQLRFLIGRKRSHVLLIGYNVNSKGIIREMKKDKAQSKKAIVLYSGNITDADKIWLRKQSVVFKQYAPVDLEDAAERKKLLEWADTKKLSNIILFEEDELLNYSNYLNINYYILNEDAIRPCEKPYKKISRRKKTGVQQGLSEADKLRIDINYETTQTEQLIYDFYTQLENDCKKYHLSTFSVPMLRSQQMLMKYPIANIADGVCKDVHLLIIGFGKMGERFLKRAINQSVAGADNRIIVDIVDMNGKDSAWFFEGMNPTYYSVENGVRQIHVKNAARPEDRVNPVADGELLIRFHEMDVRDSSFIYHLPGMETYTYIAICLDSPLLSLGCMQKLNQFYKGRNRVDRPIIAVRIDGEYNFEKLNDEDSQTYIMPSVKEVVKVENLQYQALNEISEQIHVWDVDGGKSEKNNSFFDEARRYRLLHYEVKEKIISGYSKEDCRKLFELLGGRFTDDGSSIWLKPQKENKSEQTVFAAMVKNNADLFKLGAIEHRRWAYHKILNGYSLDRNERSDFKRTVKHLVPFCELLEDENLNNRLADEYKDWMSLLIKRIKGE